MPLQATSGAASYDAFGGGVPVVPAYIEEVFSTYLYTGNGTTNTIVNGLDLSGKGGLVWIKGRNTAYTNLLFTSGLTSNSYYMQSNGTNGESNGSPDFNGFNSNGFTLEAPFGLSGTALNGSGNSFVSWSLRKQPKFFDVVTFTKSSSPQTISHSLGSTPGCIFIKRTDSTGGWLVAHRGYSGGITAGYTLLNTTDAFTSDANAVTAADSTSFTLGSSVVSGDFVAYLFAHDAGGFGLTGTDNVISCGSYVGASGRTVNLGYEPQLVIIKRASDISAWRIYDNMRGVATSSGSTVGSTNYIEANTNIAETTVQVGIEFNSTGFAFVTGSASSNNTGDTYIYIAIRRGPMKVPTSAASVFGINARTGTGAGTIVTGGQTDDLAIVKIRNAALGSAFVSRLTGPRYLLSSAIDDEQFTSSVFPANSWDLMDGVRVGTTQISNRLDDTYINYLFKRAPKFLDILCYTGTGSNTTQTHNLQAVPELMIVKKRVTTAAWQVYSSALANTEYLVLNTTAAKATGATRWNSTTPTSSVFSIGTATEVNASTERYIAFLFATLSGISKVGSYTGTGTTLQVDCGFTAGARFVLIKRTDSTGDWFTWDTARGIVSGNDPYILLNSTAAEVTSTDYIDTYSAGFEISSTAPSAINASGGTFIFLAIA